MADLAAATQYMIAMLQSLGYDPNRVQAASITRETITVQYRGGLGLVTGLGTDLPAYDIRTAVFPINLGS